MTSSRTFNEAATIVFSDSDSEDETESGSLSYITTPLLVSSGSGDGDGGLEAEDEFVTPSSSVESSSHSASGAGDIAAVSSTFDQLDAEVEDLQKFAKALEEKSLELDKGRALLAKMEQQQADAVQRINDKIASLQSALTRFRIAGSDFFSDVAIPSPLRDSGGNSDSENIEP